VIRREALPGGEIRWRRRVETPSEATRFMEAVGYCLLFPSKGLALPSLYFAMARRKPLTWDKHSVKLWEWKDQLPRKGRAFYAKYFKGRGTFIALNMLPSFLAMEASAAGTQDAAAFFAAGRISAEARDIWQALEGLGSLPTLELRHACKMETTAGNKRFKKAMLELQRLLVVVHFGAEQETAAWASGRFEHTARAFPREIKLANNISAGEARGAIAGKYLEWHPGADAMLLARLFGWSKEDAQTACGTR